MTSPLKIIFAGSSAFSEEPLKALYSMPYEIVGVLTQPDKKQGRGLKSRTNKIKTLALDLGLKILDIADLKTDDALAEIKSLKPDVILTVSYGNFIPEKILDLAAIETLNIHPSLLPKWRGATPIQTSILNGDKETGISIIRMTGKLDAGPVFISEKVSMSDGENHQMLSNKLSLLSAEMIRKHLGNILSGKIHPKEQQDEKASFCTKISKADGEINWNKSAKEINRAIKAYNPWPIAYTYIDNKYLRLWDSAIENNESQTGIPGEVLALQSEGVVIKTGSGSLFLKSLQLEGKKQMYALDFIKGFPMIGKVLGLKQ